jgi:ketosteroid isomerase-like protein
MSSDDVTAIQQVAVRYADAINRGDVRAAMDTFVLDARLERPSGSPALGRAAIEVAISEKVGTLDLIFQTVHLGLITVDGDVARARFPITEWSRRADDSQSFLMLGWYDDDLVRLAEGWRFSRRLLVPRTFAKADFMSGALLPINELRPDL